MNRVKDYILAAVAGFFTGVFILPVLYNLEIVFPFGIPRRTVLFIIPLLWMAGIWLGKTLSRWVLMMAQFSRYVASGFLSFAIDFGIFNLLIMFTSIVSGGWLAVFKGASYIFANINAYLWNKYWVFRLYNVDGGISIKSITSEYGKFLAVSLVGFVLNVFMVSYLVGNVDVGIPWLFVIHINGIGPQFGFTPIAWANVAATMTVAVVIIWNFAGYKLFVFKK